MRNKTKNRQKKIEFLTRVMTKYLLTLILALITINSFAQFNRNQRTIVKDTSSIVQVTGDFQKIKPAEFPGGMVGFYKYVSKKMKLPKDARDQKVNGKVMVQFVIDTVGNVKKESIRVVEPLIESCNKEAIRLISNSPPWTPAVNIETNKRIEILYRMPILFKTKE